MGASLPGITNPNYKHGMSRTRMHNKWWGMIQRCYNSNIHNYKNYGDRGITVCYEWKDDFKVYYKHVISLPNAMEFGYSLDRIDNDGNYEPENMRWATIFQQASNKSLRADNKSGYAGVRYRKHLDKWVATITHNKKRITIGHYTTRKLAVNSRNEYIIDNELTNFFNLQ